MTKPSAVRRRLLKGLARGLLLAAVALFGMPDSFAQTTKKREPTLRERLTLGLRARLPSELEYIDKVVDTVNRGELPEKVVNRMFFWARSRAPQGDRSKRPMIYFQAGLSEVAKSMRIDIKSDSELEA